MRSFTGLLLLILLANCAASPALPAATLSIPTLQPSSTPSAVLESGRVEGRVVDATGNPVGGAVVRIQATNEQTLTDASGSFSLTGLKDGVPQTVSAWKEGYYCANVEKVSPPAGGIRLEMRLYQTNDNPAYVWVPPTGENSCYSCKPGVTQVWLENDAHGKSAQNPRFLSMYFGSDLKGNLSPPTRHVEVKDYNSIPLPPDPSKPYYGPGYRLDFPDNNGNCASCHMPAADVSTPSNVDPGKIGKLDSQFGIHCDFCHKVADVRLNPEDKLPYPNMTGVLSMDVRRPFPEDKDRYQLFFGTFDDDNVPKEDTRLPLLSQSRFCASCHYGVFWDTVIYNSYGEWLQSPYSDPASGKTCQQCHMPSPTLLNSSPLTNVAPGKGGVERDPLAIHAHTFPGGASSELLQNAVSLQADGQRNGDRVEVIVRITNDRTGHSVPSDSPLRQVILLVEAWGKNSMPLGLLEGPRLPDWTGVGDPRQGNYAGLPGVAYARVLAELWTEISPSGAYWNPTRLVSDNRLAAYASDTSRYVFSAAGSDAVTVQVRLLYRRAYIDLMRQKGWDVPDIVMKKASLDIR